MMLSWILLASDGKFQTMSQPLTHSIKNNVESLNSNQA